MMASIHATVGGEVLFFISMNGVLAFQKNKDLKDRVYTRRGIFKTYVDQKYS